MSRFDEGCGAAIRRPRRRDVVKYGIAAASAPAMAAAAVGTNVQGVAYESRAAGDPSAARHPSGIAGVLVSNGRDVDQTDAAARGGQVSIGPSTQRSCSQSRPYLFGFSDRASVASCRVAVTRRILTKIESTYKSR